MTATVLQTLPNLIAMQRSVRDRASSLKPNYTFNELKPFFLMSKKCKYSFAQLLTIKNLEGKQLPIELIMTVRDCLVNQLMVDKLKFEHEVDSSLANYFVFDSKAHFEDYVTLHPKLFQHSWSTLYPLPSHFITKNITTIKTIQCI